MIEPRIHGSIHLRVQYRRVLVHALLIEAGEATMRDLWETAERRGISIRYQDLPTDLDAVGKRARTVRGRTSRRTVWRPRTSCTCGRSFGFLKSSARAPGGGGSP